MRKSSFNNKSKSFRRDLFMAGSAFTSIKQLPNINAAAAFIPDSSQVFNDDVDIVPITLADGLQYVPWGTDNQMPYHVLDMIERDETLSTCQMFNAEVCYGNGLQYNTNACNKDVTNDIICFLLCNNMATYLLGVWQGFKHFGWCVSVIILDNEESVSFRCSARRLAIVFGCDVGDF